MNEAHDIKILTYDSLLRHYRSGHGEKRCVLSDYGEVPPKVDYTVTPFGITLIEALLPLCEWGVRSRTRALANTNVEGKLESR